MTGEEQKWVTFDCYGTLLDWQGGFRTILRSVAGDRTDELVDSYHDFEIAVETEDPTASYKHVLTESLTRGAAAIGLDLSESDRGALARDWAKIDLYPDTLAALDALHTDGWKLGILTNCDDDLFAATQAKLHLPIDLVITAEQAHSYKPALGHFVEFERQTGIDRSRWVHSAVAWKHDMLPARELGLARVWVDRERSGEDDSVVTTHIYDMASLPQAARDISSRWSR